MLEFLYAPACAACDAPVEVDQPFCEVCAMSLVEVGPACPHCGQPSGGPAPLTCPSCRTRPPPFVSLSAPFLFGGELATALRRLKFAGRRDVARTLAPLLGPPLAAALTRARADLIIPVPLHWRRMARRGFNQSDLLTRHATRGCRRAERPRLDRLSLRRVRSTLPQTRLDARARRRNVDGAFAVVPRRTARVAGRRILLVDDVATTGATLAAAAGALLAAGAAQVAAFCVARADSE